MSKIADRAFLAQLCTSGVDLMAGMPVASEYLHRCVPSFGLSLIRVDEQCSPTQHYSEHFDELSHRMFATLGPQLTNTDGDPAAFGKLLRQPRPYGTLIDTRPEYVTGPVYQYFFRRNGIHHCLDVALRDRRGPIAILGLFREEGTRPFTRSDVASVAEIYPLLVHGMRATHVAEGFDAVETAMIVVDRRGAVQWSSPRARVWLEDALFGAERTAFIDKHLLPEACRWLATRCRRVMAGKDLEAPTMCLPTPGGRLRLRAHGLDPLTPGNPSYVGIELTLEMSRELKVLAALARSSLTPQQRRIAHGLWRGDKPSVVRGTLDVSAATMKSYLKDLYARLDVNSSGELLDVLNRQAAAVDFDLRRHRPS